MGVLTLTLLLGPKDDLSTTHTLISPEPQRQPPLNLYDLVDFVDIEPGVLDLVDRRLVVDQPFAISTKEVTRRDWQEIMKGRLRPLRWGRDLPITYVTPAAVSAFLAKLNELDKSSLYRLPTAVEWEYAARAGSADLFFFGNDPQQLPQYGNCKTPKTDGYDDSPAPVGRFKPNNWGLRDVHGNVAEWVQWPPDLGPAVDKEGRELALRLGGSFDHLPENCAFSDWSPVLADAKRKETGFRVVKVPAPASSP